MIKKLLTLVVLSTMIFTTLLNPSIAAETQTIPWTHLDYELCYTNTNHADIDSDIIAFSTREEWSTNKDLNNDGKISYSIIGYHNTKINKTTLLPYEGMWPSISGGKVAFFGVKEKYSSPNDSIKIYDITTKELFDTGIVNHGPVNNSNQYFNDNILTYTDNDGIVKYVDYNTGEYGSTGVSGNAPTIDNGIIAFSDSQYGMGIVYSYDISKKLLTVIGSGYDARVFSDKVIWTEYNKTYEPIGSKIIILELSTNRTDTIYIETGYIDSNGLFLDGDYLVYLPDWDGPLAYYNIKTKVTKNINIDFPNGVCCFLGFQKNIAVFEVYSHPGFDTGYNCDLGYAYLPINTKGDKDKKSNHGQYVSSVSKSTESGPGKGETIKDAAKSMEGMPECSNKK